MYKFCKLLLYLCYCVKVFKFTLFRNPLFIFRCPLEFIVVTTVYGLDSVVCYTIRDHTTVWITQVHKSLQIKQLWKWWRNSAPVWFLMEVCWIHLSTSEWCKQFYMVKFCLNKWSTRCASMSDGPSMVVHRMLGLRSSVGD